MSCVLRLMTTLTGIETEFDLQYVKAYDPSVHLPDGSYDGGLLKVTSDVREALQFADVGQALAKWREVYGLRADGLPNRPLTMWSVEVETIPEAVPSSVQPVS